MGIALKHVEGVEPGSPPARRSRLSAVAIAVAAVAATPAVGSGAAQGSSAADARSAATLAGTWRALPAAPIVPADTRLVGVWTGTEMFLFDRVAVNLPDVYAKNAAVAYRLSTDTWRTLNPPAASGGNYEGSYVGAWTGKVVVMGGPLANFTYNPSTNRWRTLRVGITGPMAVWTGREMIGWGGGCCGDASADGLAYNPSTNTSRKLPRSPLAPSQRPIGVWTGSEVIILVSGLDPDTDPYPRSLARAAAYNPRTGRWRRIAPLPLVFGNARAVWDGTRLLVVGAGKQSRTTLAYNLATNRWRVRAAAPSPLSRVAPGQTLWTGKRVILWRGRDGLAYSPRTNRWSRVPPWPFASHDAATMVWTGRALIVWGFSSGPPPGTGDGAVFTPAAP